MRKPLIRRIQIICLSRLLNMMYRPAEIAEEIGINVDTIYRGYIPAGMPYQRDGKGNIWIHGTTFAAWAKETVARRASKRSGMPAGFAWCMRCNKAVPLVDPKVKVINHYLALAQGKCPDCGQLINRGQARRAS